MPDTLSDAVRHLEDAHAILNRQQAVEEIEAAMASLDTARGCLALALQLKKEGLTDEVR